MSLAKLERKILVESRKLFENPELQNRDIREWSNDKERVVDNCEEHEVVGCIDELAVWVCVFKTKDKRGAE